MKNLLFLFLISSSILSQNQSNTIIEQYLQETKSSYMLIDSDVDEFAINNEIDSKSMGMKILYINQTHNGIKIHNAISTISIKDSEVFYYTNNFLKNITEKINSSTPIISPNDAILNVINHYGLSAATNLRELSSDDNSFIFTSGGVSQHDIPVDLAYFNNSESSINLVWDLSIHTLDGKFWYSVRVDALNGEILNKSDWIINCSFESNQDHKNNQNNSPKTYIQESETQSILTDGSSYNVFALPAESPIHGPRQLLSEPSSDVASPYGWHDINGVDGPEYTITRGNNVWAREDVDGLGGNGYSADGTSELNFDFELNFDQQPIGYQDASLTNLFYINNMMHDIWYQYGFDEQSGNFQENNYGNSSSFGGGDSVNADGQDGDGMNNASFGTPADGANPSMTMYLWNGPNGEPLTINNGAYSGSYSGGSADFGDSLPTESPVTADLVLVTDDPVLGGDIYDACETITNGSEIAGKIAVIRRGTCEFGFKVLAAQAEGAVAVIIVNNVQGSAVNMGGGADGGSVTIPSIMVAQDLGNDLISELESGITISGSLIGTIDLDGSFDNGIVSHEYGHGISNRLTGGSSSVNCMNNAEQMGEGWSDWFGLMITIEEGDSAIDPRGTANFASGIPLGEAGLSSRKAPYTTDFSINDYTYGDSNDESNITEPHGVGFVFATMLWDLTWAYIDKYGFDSDLFNGTGGNNKVMQLVLDGLKLQPCSPGFIDGRDAILAADLASTGGQDQCLIWEVFANRGLGYNASQGDSGNRTDQIEDFSLPPDEDPSLENCEVLSVLDIENMTRVYPNPANGSVNIISQFIDGATTVKLIDLNGRIVFEGNYNFENKINVNLQSISSGVYILNLNNNGVIYNHKLIIN